MENWKVIHGTDGALDVSDAGRVRSNLRDGRILKQQKDSKGYCRVRVTINRRKFSLKVHREVAKAFLDNPQHLPQVNHIDGNKENNSASNLEWISNADNARHAIKTGLWSNVFAAYEKTNSARKTPVVAENETTGERLYFDSVSDAERYFNSRHISDVLKGKRDHVAGHRFYREVM